MVGGGCRGDRMQLARVKHQLALQRMQQAEREHARLLGGVYDVIIYTDGSGQGKDSFGGWGVVCGDPAVQRSGGARNCGSYGAEVEALLQGMYLGAELYENGWGHVLIRADNQSCVKGVTTWLPRWELAGWKTFAGDGVTQAKRWKRILSLLRQYPGVFAFEWIKGHAGDPLNEAADKLAGEERKRGR